MADEETPSPGSELFDGDLGEDRELPEGIKRALERHKTERDES